MSTDGPSPAQPKPPRKRIAGTAREVSDILELPFTLVASIAIGGGLGYFLDSKLHTSPAFTLVLGLLGFAAGMVQLLRRLSKDTKTDGRS